MASLYDFTLEDIFQHANIEDVYEDPAEENYEITFVMRESKRRYTVAGHTLTEAIESGVRVIDEQLTIDRLRSEGLNDDDISRLSVRTGEDSANEAIDQFAEPAQVWNRGYLAGLEDAARTIGTAVLDSARNPIALSAAAQPVAGEPVTGTVSTRDDEFRVDSTAVLEKHPLIKVIYAPVAIVQGDDA